MKVTSSAKKPKSIDRDSVIPYYYQLKEYLKRLIDEKQIPEGEKISSEMELCREHGVSRTVVRQALNELVNEGLLTRRKGKGTFVSRPKIIGNLLQDLYGFHKDMTGQDLEVKSIILDFCIIEANKKVVEILRLKPGEKVFKLVRLRYVNNEPIVYVTSYIPYSFCPGLVDEDLSKVSLYSILEKKYGLEIVSSRRSIEAIAATEDVASMLDMPKDAPLLLLRSVSYHKNDIPVEYYEAKHRGDRSGFTVNLVRRPGQNLADPHCLKIKNPNIV